MKDMELKYRSNNTPNKMIEHEGNVYWISRSIAVVGLVFVYINGDLYVLMNKRGEGCSDFRGYWNLPCGYLDWDESGAEAVVREVYEETGLNLNNHFLNIDIEPFKVETAVTANKQNVTLRYKFILHLDKLPELTNEFNENNETAEIGWFKIEEIENKTFAFGHKEIIKEQL